MGTNGDEWHPPGGVPTPASQTPRHTAGGAAVLHVYRPIEIAAFSQSSDSQLAKYRDGLQSWRLFPGGTCALSFCFACFHSQWWPRRKLNRSLLPAVPTVIR